MVLLTFLIRYRSQENKVAHISFPCNPPRSEGKAFLFDNNISIDILKNMNTVTITRRKESLQETYDIEQLKRKAAFWDDFVEFMEDKVFGELMNSAEKEKSISLSTAKKILR